jgi:hypothetical protein
VPQYASINTPCGSASTTECTDPDSCDAAGKCLRNDKPANTPCGSSTSTECSSPDTCSGTGTCAPNDQPQGTPCGSNASTDCTDPDTCNGAGTCQTHDAPDNTACADCPVAPCQGCISGICVGSDYTLDVGPFGSDYAVGDVTRGYFFTAPVNFTITGLRVPTDVGTDVQNIEVLRLNIAPPTYPTNTANFTSLGYYPGVPGTNFIAVSIAVQAGQIIGVLGARGTSPLHNSYAQANTYATTILGQAVTLHRLRSETNLNTAQTTAVSTNTNTPYARIEMTYTP